MTNINCSANCIYESNGKCTLNIISTMTNFTDSGSDCAYFKQKQNTPGRECNKDEK
ncbi:MAG: hydroxymyristoyl-ACP dehydratase [Clostridiales bacterium]|nr:hydroxymyristoyl-ACP dehydratase [Clostridiales bacterium]HBM79316.1 hydroxymyristoyl-ACP dehydratase [Clostridiaceae bacterium]